MKELLQHDHWLRVLASTTVLFALLLLPKHANAQCAISYADIVADETNVYGYAGVIDYYNQCIPGMYDFYHYYGAQFTISSPAGRTAGAGNYSYAYGGGGGTEAWGQLGIAGEVGIFSLASSVGISCSVAGGLYGGGEQRTVAVPPSINGPHVVWYFGAGVAPANQVDYPTEIELTSSGGAGTTWSYIAGSPSKISLTLSPSGSGAATVKSSGEAFSSEVNDILIWATANGAQSPTHRLTTRTPYDLELIGTSHECDPDFGYVSFISYKFRDQLMAYLTGEIGFNEFFPGYISQTNNADEPDFPTGHDWIHGGPNGNTASASPEGTGLTDRMEGQAPGHTPPATCGGTGPAVVHWPQEFRVGTPTPGFGKCVQKHRLQKYTNSSLHTFKETPCP